MKMGFSLKCFVMILFCSSELIGSFTSSSYNDAGKHFSKVTSDGNRIAVNPREKFQTDEDRGLDHRSKPLPDTATYGSNSIANPAFPPEYEMPGSGKSGEVLLNRKARGSDARDQLGAAKIDIYEADPEKNTISVRLSPFPPAEIGIDEYRVSVIHSGSQQDGKFLYQNSEELKCTLWENSVCLEKFRLPSYIKLTNANSDTNNYVIKVEGLKKKELQGERSARLALDSYTRQSSAPTNLTITRKGHGIMEVKWQHPWLPRQKINKFKILVSYLKTKLLGYQHNPILPEIYPVVREKKEYSLELYLRTSTQYQIDVMVSRKGKDSSEAATETKWLPSGVAFADGEKLQMTRNGIFIKLKPLRVVNATIHTTISVEISSPTDMTECIAAQYNITEYERKNSIVIGSIGNITTPFNCALHLEETYRVKVRVIDDDSFSLSSATLTSTRNFSGLHDDEGLQKVAMQNMIHVIILPILAVCLTMILYLLLRQRQRRRRILRHRRQPSEPRQPSKPREPSYVEPNSPPQTTAGAINSVADRAPKRARAVARTPKLKTPRDPSYIEFTSSSSSCGVESTKISMQTNAYETPDVSDSRSVSIGYFEEYVKTAVDSGLLRSQFMLLQGGLKASCGYGSLPENMPKNRDKNLIAYDDTRVVLEKIRGHPCSDYINASYIQGYKKEKAYIATQGPMPNTVNDFWRMVWQENVRVICMLTNVIEDTETKCEQYWPDTGTKKKYGDFVVSNMDHQVFADYTFRKLEMIYKHNKREVTHLHYTGWPSLGVPTYPQSLVGYLKELKSTPAGHGPVVVHCNAGDGRTGTVILCDICLCRAAVEKVIDVPAVMKRMRGSRANMVGTLQQYLLAHIVIIEGTVPSPTQIPCTKVLPKRIKKMRTQLQSDMQRIDATMWQEEALQTFAELSYQNANVKCPEVVKGTSNTMNVVSVDGIKVKKEYLACCLPSPVALSNFWAFVTERNIKLMIILQCSDPRNPTCSDILPNESIVLPTLNIRLKNKTETSEKKCLTNEKLLLTNPSEKNGVTQSVTVLTCKGWGRGENGEPPSTTTLVSLWMASEKIPRKEDETLVLCHDGITGCGLYLALSFLLKKMSVEKECDVISAVRAVRHSRPEFVRTMEEFEYLYDAAETYMKCFECYANFS